MVPGLQSLQRPLVASQFPQGRGSLSQAVPAALQTCGVVPEQRFEPGWQTPPQLPPVQMFAHIVPEAGQ